MTRINNPAPYEIIQDVESNETLPGAPRTRNPSMVALGARLVATVSLGAFLVVIGTAAITTQSPSASLARISRFDEVSSSKLIGTSSSSWAVARSKLMHYSSMPDDVKRAEFVRFKAKYGRAYPSLEEEEQRFVQFVANLKRIDNLNEKATTVVYDVNEFTDMSDAEFRKYKLGYDSTRSNMGLPGETADWEDSQCTACMRYPDMASYTLDNMPTDFDWRDYDAVTPVKNQAMCGSCWSFSTTGNVEGAWYLSNHDLISLSEQQLVACDTTMNMGCNGGLPLLAMQYLGKAGGILTEDDYPYKKVNMYTDNADMTTPSCNVTIVQKSNYAAHISTWQRVSYEWSSSDDEDTLALALMRSGPLSLALDATGMESYSAGIDNSTSCSTTLNHAVLLVGFGEEDGVKYWTIKNSWGYWWGENGYYRIARGYNRCGLALEVVNALV